MKFQTAVDIDAAPATVWRALTDVESWPKWSASMTSVERLQEGDLGVGSSARVTQPKLKAAVYTVTECEPGTSFVWEMEATGVKVRASHVVEERGECMRAWCSALSRAARSAGSSPCSTAS